MKHYLLALLLALAPPAFAQAPKSIRLGVLNDMSGVYADYQGVGSVVAAQMAVDEAGGKLNGVPIEVVSADHQNQPDVGATIARKWFDLDGVDVVLDVPNSAVAFAVAQIARDKNKVFIGSGAGSAELTGSRCSPNTVHWTYDTWELGHALGRAVMARGGKKWFFVTADYAFGYDLEGQAADAVKSGGGTVVGSVRHPLGTSDFSSYLLQRAIQRRRRPGAGQCRRRHHHGDQAGQRIRPDQEDDRGRPDREHQRHRRHWPEGLRRRAGAHPVLLGLERRHPQLRQALRREASAPHHAERHAGRRLRRRAALPEGGAAGRQRRRRPCRGGGDEAASRPTTRCSARAASAPTAASCIRCICSKPRPRRNRSPNGTCSSCSSTVPADQAFRPMADGKCPLVGG